MSLILEGISKSYPGNPEPLKILDECTFSLEKGETIAVCGPSGSGKSTLLSIIGTLQPPSSGHVELDGVDPFTLNGEELARFRREKIGFVFQDHHLLPQCSALENVLLPVLAGGNVPKKMLDRAKTLLSEVGLSERFEHRPGELSGGERQRVAIARALVNSPNLLLADEPTGNLDPGNAGGIIELLLELRKEREMILVLVTHDPIQAEKMQRQFRLGSLKGEG